MTVALTPPARARPEQDSPRKIVAPVSASDRVFRAVLRGAGITVLAITGMILVFLLVRAAYALRADGIHFFTQTQWLLQPGQFGIAAILPDGMIIAAIAMIVAVPVALATALFISEYAPAVLRKPLIAMIDLMAAIPSIIYGLWGRFFLMPRIIGTSGWLAAHLGVVPPLKATGQVSASTFASSPFIAGLVVSLMAIPIITSLSREVFSQAPQGEREAAYALGSTRWGMIRTVVMPFGRAGVIGASMLGLGRALGETIAVALIIEPAFLVNWHILQSGGNSVAAFIAISFSEAGKLGLSGLMGSGLVLFTITLIVNSLASIVIGRSRSGSATAAD